MTCFITFIHSQLTHFLKKKHLHIFKLMYLMNETCITARFTTIPFGNFARFSIFLTGRIT